LGSRIGELLLKSGLINEEQLERALKIQQGSHRRLGEILIELGYISPPDLVWILSEQASIPFIEIHPEVLDSGLINSFPEKLLYDNCVLPLYESNDKIYIAIGDPTNQIAIEELKNYTKKEVMVSGADPNKINELLDKYYLAKETEEIFNQFKEKVTITIYDDKALIETTGRDGKPVLKQARVEIIIKLEQFREKE